MKLQIARFFLRSLLCSPAWWAGVLLSGLLAVFVSHMVDGIARNQFEHHVHNVHLAVQSRIQSYTDLLRATSALFNSNQNVSRGEFHAYVNTLRLSDNFPGVRNLNFAHHVRHAEKSAFEASVRHDTSLRSAGYPDFTIWPPGERESYTVLTYLEPMDLRPEAFGFDMNTLAAASKALSVARDTGEPVSSGHIIRVKGPNEHTGIAIRAAVYRYGMPLDTLEQRRAAYYGSVGIGFDVEQMMREALGNAEALGQLRVRLIDEGPLPQFRMPGHDQAPAVVFDSGPPHGNETDAAIGEESTNSLERRIAMNFPSRAWKIEFSADRDAMLNKFDRYLPHAVLLAGLLVVLLLYSIYYFLISAKKRATELANEMTRDLRRSEAHLAEAQHMASLGSWLFNPATGNMQWSAETFHIFGIRHSNGDVSYPSFLAQIHDEDRQAVRDGLENSILTGATFDAEHRIVRPDGSVRWVHTISRPVKNERRQMVRGTVMDVTERKTTLQALERSHELLRELTAYQDRIKEEERRRIAREIHDELGQTLLALRIDMSMLEVRTGKTHQRLNAKIRSALQQLDTTVRTIRTIINDLRPSVLDLGLTAAIEWQVAEFRRRSGIECELFIGQHDIHVDSDCATTLFRILQESLANITRHAHATRVAITVYTQGDRLCLKIMDNGVGMQPEDRKKSNSFGLLGIEERVLALDGEFSVISTAGKGTTLHIVIPWKGLRKESAGSAVSTG